MTGEVDLLGNACAIGGLYSKLQGALIAGVKQVLIPYENKNDLEIIFKKEEEEQKNMIKITKSKQNLNSLLLEDYKDDNKIYFRSTMEIIYVKNIFEVLKHGLVENDLVFNTAFDSVSGSGGDIYYWAYTSAFNTRAVLLSSLGGAVAVPQKVQKILFTPQGFLLALGCTNYDATAGAPNYLGTYDPLLVRWSNVDPDIGPEPENWQPTTTNTAGFLRLQSGNKIITAINTRQETLIFTNLSLTSLQFLGSTEVFGIQELSNIISIIGANAIVGAQYYLLDGS
jgi:hypothetical protein